jgi:hypothetical protein
VGISQADKAMEYQRYAEHCLKIAQTLPNQEDRIIHREMVAEWFKLAERAARADPAPDQQADLTGKRTDHG